MRVEDRKAAAKAYKERKTQAGVFPVRCTSTGQGWVGSAFDLSTIQNRLWFTLAQGNAPHRTLQQSWTAHGAGMFTFAVLEAVEEQDAVLRVAALKALVSRWVDALQASRL